MNPLLVIFRKRFLLGRKRLSNARQRVRKRIGRALRDGVVILAITLVLLIGVDRLLGLFVDRTQPETGILFPGNSYMRYETSEFSFVSKINSMGFRGGEPALPGSHRFRIIAVGDSFTYGWGVELEESWPKVLEKNLRDAGLDAEVLILARPALGPSDYVNVVNVALDQLKPDVVLLGLLQCDDFMSCWPQDTTKSEGVRIPTISAPTLPGMILKELIPNITELLQRRNTYRKALEPSRRVAEDAIPEGCSQETREAILRGDVLPFLVVTAAKDPDAARYLWQKERPEWRQAQLTYTKCLESVRTACERHQAALLAVSIPHPCCKSETARNLFEELGFTLPPDMLRSSAPDDVNREAAREAGVDCVVVTDSFLAMCPNEDYFFRWDMHFNERGYRRFADALTPHVVALLKGLASGEKKVPTVELAL